MPLCRNPPATQSLVIQSNRRWHRLGTGNGLRRWRRSRSPRSTWATNKSTMLPPLITKCSGSCVVRELGELEPKWNQLHQPTPHSRGVESREPIGRLGLVQLDSLRQAGARVSRRLLVRELRRRTGCSRAGAYRAVADAFVANVIGCA
jgi:hypothetical protein